VLFGSVKIVAPANEKILDVAAQQCDFVLPLPRFVEWVSAATEAKHA
jgi:hypothetical protein